MEEPFVKYVHDSMGRIEGEISELTTDMRKMGVEVQAVRDVIRWQEQDRKSFQATMLSVSSKICTRVDEVWAYFAGKSTVKGVGCDSFSDSGERKLQKRKKGGCINVDDVDGDVTKDEDADKVACEWKLGDSYEERLGKEDMERSVVRVIGLKIDNVKPCSSKSKEAVIDETQTRQRYIRHEASQFSCSQAVPRGHADTFATRVRHGPYHFVKRLPVEEHVKLINYIYGDGLDCMEEIVGTTDNYLTRGNLSCMKPSQLVSGEVINIIAEFLTMAERKRTHGHAETWYLPTRMTPDAMLPGTDCRTFVRTYRMKEKYMGALNDCKQICVPVNTENHWILLRIDKCNGVVRIWDSYLRNGHSMGEGVVGSVLKVLDEVLLVEVKGSQAGRWTFSNFRTETVQCAPQQPNCYDCGVFVINFMEGRASPDLTGDKYASEEERARIVVKTVLSPYNARRDNVIVRSRAWNADGRA